jgi:hypothetical protein
MRRSNKNFLLITILALSILSTTLVESYPFAFAQNGTNESGIITSDATWTKANSPYTLVGPIAVNNGVKLTIEPGVTINLADYYIQVNGTLVAKGTSADKIYFNGGAKSPNGAIAFTSRSTSWNQLTGSGCLIEDAIINAPSIAISIDKASPKINQNIITGYYAVGVLSGSPDISNNVINGQVGVSSSDSVTITGNTITGTIYANKGTVISKNTIIGENGGVGIYCSGASITDNKIVGFDQGISTIDYVSNIERNTIAYNDVGIQVGMPDIDYTFSQMPPTQHDFQVTIQNNLITKNSKGISVTHLPLNVEVAHFKATITNNNILKNFDFNFYLADTPISINAANNWWGTTDTQAIREKIHDFEDDFNVGNVTIVPFLTSNDPQAPDPNTPLPTINPSPTQTPTSPAASTTPISSIPQNTTSLPSGTQAEFYIIIAVLLVIIVILLIIVLTVMLMLRKERKIKDRTV